MPRKISVILTSSDYLRSIEATTFYNHQFNAPDVCSFIAKEALLCGASAVHISRHGQWWVIESQSDWLTSTDPLEAFSRVVPYSEGGPNSMRSEAFLPVFALDVVTYSPLAWYVVKGKSDEWLDGYVTNAEIGRLVAFRI